MAITYKIMKTITRPDGDNKVRYEVFDSAGRKMIAPDWYEHEDEAFAAGQHIVKDGILYRFLIPHTAGAAWNSAEVLTVTVAEDIAAIVTALNQRAYKVSGATANNFAALTANGDLKDSGKKASDFATAQDIYGKADKTDTVLNTTLSRGRKANTTVGEASFAFGYNVEASAYCAHAEGGGTTASAALAHAEGAGTTASETYAHAEGASTTASGYASHAEGTTTTASDGAAHAEGGSTEATAYAAHAEGASTHATNSGAHSEGNSTVASGAYSHAEGLSTTASGAYAHSEGGNTTASGLMSHAEGAYTVANHAMQSVFGLYNVPDGSSAMAGEKGNYVEIVGNGTDANTKSNARTLDWNGNERLAGDLYVHADDDGTGGDKVATEDDLDELSTELKRTIDGKADLIRDSVSNVPIASVPDAAANLPLSALKIAIDPVQDLHGQANPYPPGGNVNICSLLVLESTTNGITVKTEPATGKVTVTGTASADTTVTLSNSIAMKANTSYDAKIYNVSSNVDATIAKWRPTGFGWVNIENNAHIGLNNASAFNTSIVVQVYSGKTINVSFYPMFNKGTQTTEFSPYSNICPITGWTGCNVYQSDADTSNPTTIPISWQTEAGTVYGGTLDPVTGEMTVDRVIVTVGNSGWIYYSPYIYKTFNDKVTPNIGSTEYPLVCSMLPYDGVKYASGFSDMCVAQSANKNIYIKDTSCESENAYYQKYSDATIMYFLSTPLTYQLDPITVKTLLSAGQMNLWADTGNVIEMTYPCDTKLYIDKKLAELTALVLES